VVGCSRQVGPIRTAYDSSIRITMRGTGGEMMRTRLDRRAFLKTTAGAAAAVGAGARLAPSDAWAQGAPLKLKFGNDLPASHSVNVRLREAIDAIKAETNGRVEISLFPNNQLGSDNDMMSQLRSGALELGPPPLVWRGEIRISGCRAQGDRLHAGASLGRGSVAQGRVQALPIIQLLTARPIVRQLATRSRLSTPGILGLGAQFAFTR